MHHRTDTPSNFPKTLTWLFLVVILLTAFFLRAFELDRFPSGPFGDEAAAAILAGEIAAGRSRPIFITAYTGHEVLLYYLSVPIMWLIGAGVLALRLTSALVGTATVLATYWLARELFDDEPVQAHWLGLFAAALAATSFWHVSVSRYGYRAITLPLMQSLMLWALWRGLRLSSWKWIVAAGVSCGLVAYTYLSSRIVPVALGLVLLLVLLAERKRWRLRLAQIAVMVAVAGIVFAPLGVFFLTHPETFATRMTQVSAFSTAGADWPSVLLHSTLRALQVFTSRGDPQWRFGLPNLPMFQGILALAFYAGLIVIALRLMRPSGFLGRVRYALLTLWPLVMLIPTILSDPIEVPHSLRAIGVLPLVFLIPALGLIAALELAHRAIRSERATELITIGVLALTLIGSGAATFQNYFMRWGPEPRMYYDNNQDIADMTRFLNTLPDKGQSFYVSALDYRHPTVAALSNRYTRLKFIQGQETFVFAPGPAIYAWPHFSIPDDWWLARFFPPGSRIRQGIGPDGGTAYIVHTLDRAPVISPTHPLSVTFGSVIQAIGYDVLRDRPSGGRTDLAVYWRVLGQPDRGDYSQFFTLTDAWGIEWGRGGSFAYPSEQWAPGEIIAERVRVQTDDGTPPGNAYTIRIGWWASSTGQRLTATDAQGRFAGTTIAVGPITITRRVRPLDLGAIGMSNRLNKDFDGLMLLGFDQWPASIRQGETEFVTLYWQAKSAPLPDRQVTLELQGSDRRITELARSGPVHGTYPTSQWAAGEFVADRLALRIPPETPPGAYTLQARVDDFPVQPLGRFEVQAISRNWSTPVTAHPMSITLGSQVALVGYDLKSQVAGPKSQVELTLHWQALREMSESYTVFVHLVDADGVVRAQQDNAPINNTYPTTLWLPGEFVRDVYTLALPPDLGEYTLRVGMYLPESGARLPITGGGDHITLDRLVVP